jgi:hypothetical protein
MTFIIWGVSAVTTVKAAIYPFACEKIEIPLLLVGKQQLRQEGKLLKARMASA